MLRISLLKVSTNVSVAIELAMPSQVFVIIVIVYGSLLNLLAKPWSSTESLLERRRNDLIAIILWLVLFAIAVVAIWLGIESRNGHNALDLQDWTALVLPFALSAPYLLELSATLIRQLEMWQWMRRACIQALPVAWMYRTMTVGEPDSDGTWLCSYNWAPWNENSNKACSFWQSTSRSATLYNLFRRWLDVLISAFRHTVRRVRNAVEKRALNDLAQNLLLVALVGVLSVCTSVALFLSLIECIIMLFFDYMWWRHCTSQRIIVARYGTVHFGREEMQIILELSNEVRACLRRVADVDVSNVHNRIMGAVMSTAAVLENAFRQAYLCTPVYEVSISNRRILRDRYAEVGCDLDRLIKQVRVLLERKHTAGLMSITSSSGTIEASLHNNIESILSVCVFFEPTMLYTVASRVAQHEQAIEARVASTLGETTTRERVVYIDARNAMFWLLWTIVTRDWREGSEFWSIGLQDTGVEHFFSSAGKNHGSTGVSSEDLENGCSPRYGVEWIDALYVTATFLSRCRYCTRFGIGRVSEKGLFKEVRALTRTDRQKKYALLVYYDVSSALESVRRMTLSEWVAREYDLTVKQVAPNRGCDATSDGRFVFSWADDTGKRNESSCGVLLEK